MYMVMFVAGVALMFGHVYVAEWLAEILHLPIPLMWLVVVLVTIVPLMKWLDIID
jgi:putative effector of murein hydrolase LrgA (UPF0299 family)